MNICSKCGKSEEEIRLYDGIYVNEPIKICERCSLLEGIPIIKSPTTGQLKESEKPGRNKIYDRLKRMSGIKEEQETKSIFEELKELENNPERFTNLSQKLVSLSSLLASLKARNFL